MRSEKLSPPIEVRGPLGEERRDAFVQILGVEDRLLRDGRAREPRVEGRIEGVTRFGVFVTLDETGASGIVPVSTLGYGRARHDAERHALDIDGKRLRLGARVTVELAEADVVTGGLVLSLTALDGEPYESVAAPDRAGRGPSFRHHRRRTR